MVNDGARIEVRTRSYPTQASAERSMAMELEFLLNQPGEKGEPSIAEVYWSTGSAQQALSDLPPVVPSKIRRELQRLLQPWPDGRYVDAYRRTGGVLNLFTPPWGEKQDEVWITLVAKCKSQVFPDAQTKQAAWVALEHTWNETPHPFFAGLTPAQVMVGGGPQEARLADEFIEEIGRHFKDRAFEGEGDALIKALLVLRGWQCEARRNGRTPVEIIMAERNDLLAQRAHILAEGHRGEGAPDK
jgi:hypothetical protein